MKMRTPHTVPLSRQVIALLQELCAYTGDGEYLFPPCAQRKNILRMKRCSRHCGAWDTRKKKCASMASVPWHRPC
ncbi:MAG: hypothetical protein ACI4P0_01530 [Mailhella sp.]